MKKISCFFLLLFFMSTKMMAQNAPHAKVANGELEGIDAEGCLVEGGIGEACDGCACAVDGEGLGG